jgi:hypothetical protein
MTSTLEVLSNSRTEEGSIFCGLSPILICPKTEVVVSVKNRRKGSITFIISVLTKKKPGKQK